MTTSIPNSLTPWRTSVESAARAQCNPKTIYRAVKAGKLRAAKIGRDLRFRDEWIDEWLLSTSTPIEVRR
jgi:excisionase family DNA binding protein